MPVNNKLLTDAKESRAAGSATAAEGNETLVADAIAESRKKIQNDDFDGALRTIDAVYHNGSLLDRVPLDGLKADCYLKLDDPDSALECYTRILDVQPDAPYWAHVGYGNVLERLGRIDKACDQMLAALEKQYSLALIRRVVTLSQHTTSPAVVLGAVVDVSVEHGPEEQAVEVAELLISEGYRREGGQLFESLIKASENEVALTTSMVKSYLNAGESNLATEKVKAWKELNPNDTRLDKLYDFCQESRILDSYKGVPSFLVEDGRPLDDFELRVNGYRVRKGLVRYTRVLSDDSEANDTELTRYLIKIPECYLDTKNDRYTVDIRELTGTQKEYSGIYRCAKVNSNDSNQGSGDFEYLGRNRIHGWYFSEKGLADSLALYVNGEFIDEIKIDLDRPDVSVIHGAEYLRSGFDFTWSDEVVAREVELRDPVSGVSVLNTPAKVRRLEDAVKQLEKSLSTTEFGLESSLSAKALEKIFASLRQMPEVAIEHTHDNSVLARNFEEGVSVVIPVYNGLSDVKRCVESLLTSDDTGSNEIVCINDCSTDTEVMEYLSEIEKENDAVTIVNSEINRGFVKTVNKGLAARTYKDVVILNSDTVVPKRFIDRLSAAADLDKSFGVVTPLSNNATIFSFPLTLVSNELSSMDELTSIDDILNRNAKDSIFEMPTGHGYCMFVSGEVLEVVGGFNEEEWGIGYGEENDFCQKVKMHGWKIGAYYGMYVGHVGSVSFGDKKREAQVKVNQERLLELYPEYDRMIQRHISEENLSRIERNRLQIINWKNIGAGCEDILFLSHSLGGGTSEYIARSVASLSREHTRCIILCTEGKDIVLQDLSKSICCVYKEDEIDILKSHFSEIKPSEVVVNSACNFPQNLFEKFDELVSSYTIVVHDYSWICPRINMIDATGSYCGMPSSEVCVKCVNVSGTHASFRSEWKSVSTSLDLWLTKNKVLMENARRVIAPSVDAANRIHSKFPTVNPIVTPHSDTFELKSNVTRHIAESQEEQVIGIFGMIGDHKGLELFKKLSWLFSSRHSGIKLVFFGVLAEYDWMDGYNNVSCVGEYTAEELPELIQSVKPTAALFMSMCPETYCYALTDAVANGVFPIAFELGAFPERIQMHNYGEIIPFATDAESVYESVLGVLSGDNFRSAKISDIENGVSYTSYMNDYLGVNKESVVSFQKMEVQDAS